MATETTRVTLTRDYETNGEVIPAGSHELPKEVADDLARREQEYNRYKDGITEKREYMSRAGSISMGDGSQN